MLKKPSILARNTGAPPAECDRELSIVYGKLCEEAAANMAADATQR